MGGLGSGRPSWSGKLTTEVCPSLDVNRLNRAGVFSEGWSGGWHWLRGTERVGSISMRGGCNHLTLSYRWRSTGNDWQPVEETITLLWKPCRYGGQRPYFVCPGVVNGDVCARPVIKLYSAGRYYLCRHCYRLTYTSQKEDRWDRASRKANKIRTQLSAEAGPHTAFPTKPKGMWQRKFDRLSQAIIEAESTSEERLYIIAARLLNFRKSTPRRAAGGRKGRFWR